MSKRHEHAYADSVNADWATVQLLALSGELLIVETRSLW